MKETEVALCIVVIILTIGVLVTSHKGEKYKERAEQAERELMYTRSDLEHAKFMAKFNYSVDSSLKEQRRRIDSILKQFNHGR